MTTESVIKTLIEALEKNPDDLGMRLHKLSLDGRWQEMQEVITEDDLLKLTETCTYDDYPQFVRTNREYA